MRTCHPTVTVSVASAELLSRLIRRSVKNAVLLSRLQLANQQIGASKGVNGELNEERSGTDVRVQV